MSTRTPVPSASNSPLMSVRNLTEDAADLYIYGEIVDNTDWKWDESDVMPADVLNAMKSVEGLKTLNIYINSPGGSVFAGLAIYNMLKRNPAKKNVYVDGLAASIASVIAQAGDNIYMPANAFLMIHKPWTIAMGDSNFFRKLAEDLDVIESGVMEVYKDNMRENISIETIQQMVDDETWLTAEEAAKYFNIEMIDSKQVAACATHVLQKYNKTPDNLIKFPETPVAKSTDASTQNEKNIIAWQNELDLLAL